MVKKAIDARIPALIRNGAQEKKRSFFVVVGDRQKDVIVNLYHILLNVDLKLNKSVLWAYKNKLLGFTSHRQKREKKIRKEIKRGTRDADTDDPFELFVSTQNIRYVYYKETEKILGNTYGMCILQDFEAITPNLLARTIETVEGGGLVLLLLKGMNSLKQLYTMSMDVHSRYRTEAHGDVVARFNERFILSLGSCESCLVVDDELNVLPISGGRLVKQLPPPDPEAAEEDPKRRELEEIKESLADTKPVGPLISLARTVDQAKALLTFVDAIAEKTLQSTVTLTAARGRGKSAALGVAIAAAVAHGYSNIFITSPSPENLKTLFEFIFKGFDALGYQDHADYTIIQSTNPAFNKAIVRVNIHRNHRQTIQYIQPQDAYTLGQAELLVIDEAAAIPLPLVRKLMGPYLVFMASTINGYEGTGRSLSLKLIQQLREQSRGTSKSAEQVVNRKDSTESNNSGSGRSLREIKLLEPIRYAQGDAVESWLNRLLCLDATLPSAGSTKGFPHPSKCELLQVNRDTLFSFHHISETFLQQMMALYVASHYKNSPNDLQLMSDAPAHQLFVLVPPTDSNAKRLPEPLCVIQLALEGQISRETILNSLSRGRQAGGDLIPWLISQQFQDEDFAGLSGARIIRIATNPDYINMGYGSRALQLLTDYFEGKFLSLSETDVDKNVISDEMIRVTDAELESATLLQDNVKIRDINSMPALFSRLSERKPVHLDYLGVSYGLTSPLHKFWKRATFVPVYLRQTANDLTGEHTCVMLRTLQTNSTSTSDSAWLAAYAKDFHRRFLSLLSYQFRTFASSQALAIEEAANVGIQTNDSGLDKKSLDELFSPFDLKRLDSYAENMLDYHVILDLLPRIAEMFFRGKLIETSADGTTGSSIQLSSVQKALLCAIGLQRKTLEDLEKELGLQASQLLSMFIKVIRKISSHFRSILKDEVVKTLPARIEDRPDSGETTSRTFQPLQQSLEDELEEGGDLVDREEKDRMKAMIDALPLDRYDIANDDSSNWEDAEKQIRTVTGSTSMVGRNTNVSVPKKRENESSHVDDEGEIQHKKKSEGHGSDKKRKSNAMEDARRELEKVQSSKGGGKKRKLHQS